MEEALNLTVDLERGRNSGKALPAARDLLALEESLAGKTSEPCLRGLEVLASATEQTDDPASALPLRRRAIAISDLVYLKTDTRRAYVRLSAAQLLSRLGRLDEAEQMLQEARAMGRDLRPPQPDLFHTELEQIQRRKAALAQQH